MKRIVIGLAAHVDSGKTTLAEALLYTSGAIRKQGRVDSGSAFLDTAEVEKNRGITVFSKQAVLKYNENEYTLLDTPGHIDFSAETERAFRALDYAILLISAPDGVQGHTETLWRLLKRYNIPTFVFVNKTDISYRDNEAVLRELKRRLSPNCVDFSENREDFSLKEELAECSENMLNTYLQNEDIPAEIIAEEIKARNVFPVLFGSALKLTGIKPLLSTLDKYTIQEHISDSFGAVIYKITSDEQNTRLAHLKITSGSLKVKTPLEIGGITEKINQIRIYSGVKFTAVDEAFAGSICAVTGLSQGKAGDTLGIEAAAKSPLLEPVLTYRIILPPKTDIPTALARLQTLSDEDPALGIFWNEQLKEIHIKLMGEIQLEILRDRIKERFGTDVEFDSGGIAYKETISAPVVGMGHFEPLRHYAEVHLLLEPAEQGTGLQFFCNLQKDSLDVNFQRLIISHLEEKTHIGVLTGSPITDMKITLVAGKAHLKHTEGGDFRQAVYRAVRQGLRSAKSVLLEPWYDFELTIPAECTGRAMTDLQRMSGEISPPETAENETCIKGSVPVSEIMGYTREVIAYSHGKGRLNCIPKGYFPCHNAEEIIAKIGYNPDNDVENTADSVFCSHGAGVVVPWNEAPAKMHVDSGISFGAEKKEPVITEPLVNSYRQRVAADKELMEIFERTYGKIKRREYNAMRTPKPIKEHKEKPYIPAPKAPEYLLVDGYNIIFSWEELNALSKQSLDLARARLINILANYRGFKQCNLILVFDAYKVKGNHREIETQSGITVVYTKEAETADMYIEKTAHELRGNNKVRVATSDSTEQMIILGSGALRVSASELLAEVTEVEKAIRSIIENKYSQHP